MLGYIYLALILGYTQARPQDNVETRDTDQCPAEGHWLLPHEYDCTKFYYCEYGQKVTTPRDCAPGTQFSYAMQVCIHPVLANCNLSGVPPATEAPTTEATTSAPTTTEASTTTTTSAPTSTQGVALPEAEATTTTEPEVTEIELLPNGCPSDFSIHKLLPHETECNLFYYCNFGEKVLRECAPGTDFNPSLEVCDWPENAGCANSGNETNTTSAPMATETATTEAATTEAAATEAATTEAAPTNTPTTEDAANENATTEEPTTEATTTEAATLPNGCPSDFNIHQLLPHETDCNLFYYCNFGEKVLRECAPGTHFNPTLQVCDWPEEAGCTNSGNETTTTSVPTTTGAATTDAVTMEDATTVDITTEAATTEDSTTEAATLPNGCPSDFSIHQLLPHETDCNLFYYCNFGEKVLRECAPGTHFNPTLQVCDWPEDAGCTNSGNETTTTSVPTTTGAATTDAVTTEEATTVDITTEAATTEDATTEAATTEAATLPNGCPSDFSIQQLLPHETDCNLFYYCNFGEKVLRECAPGTHFNPTLQVCDWPEDAGCTNSGNETTTTSVPTTTGAATTDVVTTEDATTVDITTEAATTEDSTTEAATLPNGCPSDFSIHQLLPHETDCNLFYYCNFGEKVLRECAPGTHFNPTLQVCDWPEDAGCTNSGNETTTTSVPTTTGAATTDVVTTEDATTVDITTEAATTEDSTTEAATLPNGCPSDFSIHQLLPHETDCNLFYYCNFGEKVLRECAPGTNFNPTLQVCDWPEDAGCTNSGNETTTTSVPTTTGAATTDAVTTEDATTVDITTEAATTEDSTTEAATTEAVTLPNGCPSDFSIHQLLPHETDCNLFYYCNFGEKVLRECAPGTHFNPTLQVCDWPENAGCTNSGNETTTTSVPTTTGAATTDAVTTEEATTVDITTEAATTEDSTTEAATTEAATLPNGCPSDFSIHQLLPHETDCNLFYYCNFGEKVLRECAPGTHFYPTLQVCDWPEDAGCTNSGNETTTTSVPTTTGAATTDAVTTEDATTVDITTEAATTEDSTTEAATTEAVTLPNGCPSDFSIHQLLPHETDCNLFYYCNFGEKVLRECAPGTHFNPTLQVCDWPENAGCTNSGNETTTTSVPTTTGAATTDAVTSEDATTVDITTEAATTEDSTTGAATTEAATLPNGCPSDFTIHQLLPHETNCNLFYYCNFGEKVLRECAPGTHFNPSLQVCDWPENAGCANSGNETTTSAPTTTETATTEASGDNECPADWDQHQLLPHESDCGKFYQCVYGQPVERDCPEGTHFNAVLEVCDWPENAGCGNSGNETTTEGPTTTEAANITATDAPTTTEAVNSTTTDAPTTTEAGNSTTTVASTPTEAVNSTTTDAPTTTEAVNITTTNAPNTTESVNSTTTDAPTTVAPTTTEAVNSTTTDAPTTTENVNITTTNAPNTTESVNSTTTDAPTTVAPTTTENVNITTTNAPNTTESVNSTTTDAPTTVAPTTTEAINITTTNAPNTTESVNSTTTDIPTTTEAVNSTTTNAPTTTESANITTTDAPTTTEEPITEEDAKCAAGCNVLPWAHATDCDKFWSCDGEKAILTSCSEGLHFNAKTYTCDFICNANCVRDTLQATYQNDGVRIFVPWNGMDEKAMDKYVHEVHAHDYIQRY